MTNEEKRKIAVDYFGGLIGEGVIGLLERFAGYSTANLPERDPEDEGGFDDSAYRELQARKIQDGWYTTSQVGPIIGCARQTVYDWVNAGYFPGGEDNDENIRWSGETLRNWIVWRAEWNGSDLGSYRKALKSGTCAPFQEQ